MPCLCGCWGWNLRPQLGLCQYPGLIFTLDRVQDPGRGPRQCSEVFGAGSSSEPRVNVQGPGLIFALHRLQSLCVDVRAWEPVCAQGGCPNWGLRLCPGPGGPHTGTGGEGCTRPN